MGRLAFLFAGQGAQSIGMGQDLAEHAGLVREMRSTRQILDEDFWPAIWKGAQEDLNRSRLAQPALFWQGYCLARLLLDAGIKPDLSCGLSLGEYTALAVAGAFSYADGLKLVRRRGELMSAAAVKYPGGMLALMGADPDRLRELLDEFNARRDAATERVYISNLNAPGQIVIAGQVQDLEEIQLRLRAENPALRVSPLAVEGAFHSPFLEEAAAAWADELRQVEFHETKWPVYTNYDATVPPSAKLAEILLKQMTHSVRMEDCLRKMMDEGVDFFVEIGPGKVLTAFLRRMDRGKKVLSLQNAADLPAVLAALK